MEVRVEYISYFADGMGASQPRGRKPLAGHTIAPQRTVARRATPEMAFYRKYTEGMLRRYFRMSLEAGRVPSMLGRDLFRARVTNYTIRSFEDVVIFVQDVESCVKQMDAFDAKLLQRIAIQEYTQAEAAQMMHMSERTVMRRYYEALDELTAVFLERKLLQPMVECRY